MTFENSVYKSPKSNFGSVHVSAALLNVVHISVYAAPALHTAQPVSCTCTAYSTACLLHCIGCSLPQRLEIKWMATHPKQMLLLVKLHFRYSKKCEAIFFRRTTVIASVNSSRGPWIKSLLSYPKSGSCIWRQKDPAEIRTQQCLKREPGSVAQCHVWWDSPG